MVPAAATPCTCTADVSCTSCRPSCELCGSDFAPAELTDGYCRWCRDQPGDEYEARVDEAMDAAEARGDFWTT